MKVFGDIQPFADDPHFTQLAHLRDHGFAMTLAGILALDAGGVNRIIYGRVDSMEIV